MHFVLVENTAWPFITYNCRACESVFSFAGPAGVSTLEVEVVLEATSVAQQEALSSAVKAKLNGHSTAPIQGVFLVDESADKLGDEQEGIIYQETQQEVKDDPAKTHQWVCVAKQVASLTKAFGLTRESRRKLGIQEPEHQEKDEFGL